MTNNIPANDAHPAQPPAATEATAEQLDAVKALMAELKKKTDEAVQAVDNLPLGTVSDTIKLG